MRTAAVAPSCVQRRLGRHSPPLSPRAGSRRALLSTTSGRDDGDRETDKDKAVTGGTMASAQVDEPDADPKASWDTAKDRRESDVVR